MIKEYKEFLESEVKDIMREIITERISFEINGVLDQIFNKNNNSDELAEKISFLENQNKDLLNELEAEKEAHKKDVELYKKQIENLENKILPTESEKYIKKDEAEIIEKEKDVSNTEPLKENSEEEPFKITKKDFSENIETIEEIKDGTKVDPSKGPIEEQEKVFMNFGDRKLAAIEAKKIRFSDFKNSYDNLTCLAKADLAKKYKALVMKLKDSYFDVDRVLLNSVICEISGIKKSMLLEISKELFDENIIKEQLQYNNEKDVNLIFALLLHKLEIKSEDLNKKLNEKLEKTGFVYSNKNYLPFIID